MRQDLRIGFKTNKARTSAAVVAAVARIGARITGDGRAAFTSPRLRGEVAPTLPSPAGGGGVRWGRVRGPLRKSEHAEKPRPSPQPSPRKSGAREQKARGRLMLAPIGSVPAIHVFERIATVKAQNPC